MLTICAKCLGNMFQVIASKVQRFLRYTAFSARKLGNIFPHLILVPTNHCLDWGLRRLKPGKNRDPTMEVDIHVEAAERYQEANEGIEADQLPDDPPPEETMTQRMLV